MIDPLTGETFTDCCRRMLTAQPEQKEFTLSRAGLETLVLDSERYGEANKASNALLLTAREIASDTTTMARDAEAWLNGSRDNNLPRVLRDIASHSLKTIEIRNREDQPKEQDNG